MILNLFVAQALDGGWPEHPEYTAERLPVPRQGEHIALPGDARAAATVVAVDWVYLNDGPPFVNVLAYYDPGFEPVPVTVAVVPQDIREILSALEDAADYRRDQGEQCAECDKLAGHVKCRDHDTDDKIASMYEDLHERLQERLHRIPGEGGGDG